MVATQRSSEMSSPIAVSLTGDVGVCFLLVDAVEHRDVGLAGRARFRFVVNALAQQIERGRDATGVEPGDRGESGIEGLARHEPVGEALCQPVVANEFEYLLLAREIEQCAAKHQF